MNKNFLKFLGTLVDDQDFSEYIATSDESTIASNAAYLNGLGITIFE